MKRSQRLAVVLKLVQREEEAEAQKLGKLRQHLQLEQKKCQELVEYQAEYHQALRQGGIDNPSRLQVYHQFIARLGGAIEQQQAQIQRVEKALVKQQSTWAEVHGRRKNMESFIERCSEEEARDAEKKLQRMLDDAQARRHYSGDRD